MGNVLTEFQKHRADFRDFFAFESWHVAGFINSHDFGPQKPDLVPLWATISRRSIRNIKF